ncbi:MAG TPA: MFS transporter, partial [Blastocatellia bacterium]|nr:MFS transporter [Blastocatellia bacterium]
MVKRKAFWPIYLSVAISYLGVGLVAPLISIVMSRDGANKFVVGLVGTTMFLSFTLAAFPVGWATDRFGSRRVLVAGLLVYGGAILSFAFIQDPFIFFAIRAMEGVGGSAISVATETMISHQSNPNQRAQRMSYYALSVGAGWAIGPVAGTSLFALRPSTPFVACFALSVAAALVVSGYAPAAPSSDHHQKGLLSVFSTALIIPVSAGALYGYMMSSLVTLFPLYLTERGISEVLMGTVITAVIVGTMISQVPIGKAADKFGQRRVLLVCSLALTVLFTVLPLYGKWWYFGIVGSLIGGAAGTLYPVGLAVIGSIVSPERLGAATSLFSLAFGIGSLIG